MTREQAEDAFVTEVHQLQETWNPAAQAAAERRWRSINATLASPLNLEALYLVGREEEREKHQ